MDEQERRAAVRRAYGYRCGYCGVHESEAGSELEIDHYQPRSIGGVDDLDNLVYCCPTCNRLKGDFWPADDPARAQRRLLHPKRDDLALHFREEVDGRLTALTEVGDFHINRLRLNRLPLVTLRRTRQEGERLRQELASARKEHVRLRERIAVLEGEIEEVIEELSRLLGS
ncbi:MAG: HNH endonuclease [Anaerolineae bacterium]